MVSINNATLLHMFFAGWAIPLKHYKLGTLSVVYNQVSNESCVISRNWFAVGKKKLSKCNKNMIINFYTTLNPPLMFAILLNHFKKCIFVNEKFW